ncbi:hypothetical protein P3X46_005834 [Hevea brasiliensis]|uniref:Pectinesterase inhibitor domain-containing protein n=2 Tax=Hevea brasiliensis TaxID=3981 RepID=A0ABQ9MRQ2_HEVBR|nr:hypothetical protein P3X46_005834 [Hevea brasiliensis]
MKNPMSPTLFSLVHALLLIIFSLFIHCASVQSDATLIEYICKKTPNYTLCVSFLYTYPESATADVKGLAVMMVRIVQAKAIMTLNKIKELLESSPELMLPLFYCAKKYNAILRADIPEAIEALDKGFYKFSKAGTDDAATEAKLCEQNFHGKSPLTYMNSVVHDTSAVASAIVQILL